MKIAPNHVYVIPPNSDMSILHGALHLLAPAQPRGHNLPIDFFFRSLADDRRGARHRRRGPLRDGHRRRTLGLRAIKEKAGACFVQTIASAKFDGMPSSAIEAGLADVVAPADELPSRIQAYLRHAPLMASSREIPIDDRSQGMLDKVFVLLRSQTGNDFSLYKRTAILRRIERRMGLLQIDKMPKYVQFLRERPARDRAALQGAAHRG